MPNEEVEKKEKKQKKKEDQSHKFLEYAKKHDLQFKPSFLKQLQEDLNEVSVHFEEQKLTNNKNENERPRQTKPKHQMRPKQWLDEIINKKVREQVIIAITKLISHFKTGNCLKIYVYRHQLNIYCKYQKKQKALHDRKREIIHTTHLQNTISYKFSQKQYNKVQIRDLIEKIFKELYNCLEYFLFQAQNKQNKEKQQQLIDDIDFLLFPAPYLIQKTHLQDTNINYFKYPPIVIGGIMTICYKFFRSLFRLILNYQQELLLYIKNKVKFCNNINGFVKLCQGYIGSKKLEIAQYEHEMAQKILENVQKQMTVCINEKVINKFFNNFLLPHRKLYDSNQSREQYRKQKYLMEWQKTHKQKRKDPYPPQFIRAKRQGRIKSKIQKKYKRQIDEQIPGFSLRQINRNDQFNLKYQINQEKYREHRFILAKNKTIQVRIERTGCFTLTTIAQTSDFEKYFDECIQILSQIYPKDKYEYGEKDSHVYKAYLGQEVDLVTLSQRKYFEKSDHFEKSQRLIEIIEKENRNSRIRDLHLRIQNIKTQLIEQLYVNKYLDNLSMKESDNHDYLSYKKLYRNQEMLQQEMLIKILDQGFVMFYNISDISFPQEQFKNILSLLQQLDHQAEIKDMEKKKEENYMLMQFLGNPKSQHLSSHYHPFKPNEKGKITFYDIKHRDTMTFGNKKIICPQKLTSKRLKIFTWNIWGQRKNKNVDMREFPKLTEEEMREWEDFNRSRIQQIIEVIVQNQPDIICLQQGQCLYTQHQSIFFNQLIAAFQDQFYYFAQYQKGDLSPKNPMQISNQEISEKEQCKQEIKDRSIILTRFPAKFFNVKLQTYVGSEKTIKNFVMAQFSLEVPHDPKNKINVDQNSYKVLVISVHLQAKDQNQDFRKKQFDILHLLQNNDAAVCKSKYDICIMAGDFNSYDLPEETQYSKLSKVSQAIRDYKYINFEDYIWTKDATYCKGTEQDRETIKRRVLDKIIMKINNQSLKKKLRLLDFDYPGSHTMDHYLGQNSNLVEIDGLIRTLSDHIGRYVEIAFEEQAKKKD